QKYALEDEFILAVGHLERRKNYLRLIDAISRLREGGCHSSLVIVGNDSGSKNAIEHRIASKNVSNHVKILSHVSNYELICLYKLCGLVVFPSAYEGFGIPILEAMAARRPIVLSDIPVFREITQNRGVYFPYHDVETMAEAIHNVLHSQCERARL